MVADVLVELKLKTDKKTFTYLIPDNMKLDVGMRVLVPFGKQKLEGFVLKIKEAEKFDYEIKEIIECLDERPVLNEELMHLGAYMQKKTLSTLIEAYQTMLPSALKAKNKININKKYETYVSLNIKYEDALKLCKNETQIEIVEKLKDKELLKKDISSSSINTLIKNEIVKEVKKEAYRLRQESYDTDFKPNLTEEQKTAVNTVLKNNEFKVFLLHGVTGSGKTEVYMHLIEEKIKNGKTAIMLVPEISLTPQLTEKFLKRFGDIVAILHSGLSNGEKYDEWRKIDEGKIKIVIGARSAIFAPLKDIGIIIIDEEHSMTYKQENNPKYHATDMAIYRAKYHDIPLILGSATPSIESYTKAILGNYTLIELKDRINKNMPEVHLVSMQEEIKKGNNILSEELKDKINDRISKGEQIILLLNKRGYTRIVTCPHCGYQDKCPHCDIPLTYHKSSNTMRCHYCGYGAKKKTICPSCKSEDFKELGMGTEKLEEYVSKNINGAKVLRMDVDTTSKKGAHASMIHDFENQKYNILLGTQMIAKGLDFDNVTLVGVLNGDATLNIPDFRSAERCFQLLSQVAGRSGRSKIKGDVVIQGFNMDHYSIICAKNHDYMSFYKQEMEIRKTLKYSPYYNLTLIKLRGKNINELYEHGYKLLSYLRGKRERNMIILGPSTSAIPKINDTYSLQILIKYKDSKEVYPILKDIGEVFKNPSIKLDIDISPLQI